MQLQQGCSYVIVIILLSSLVIGSSCFLGPWDKTVRQLGSNFRSFGYLVKCCPYALGLPGLVKIIWILPTQRGILGGFLGSWEM